MMWLPFSLYISATPLMARLLLSVAPEVKMISLLVAPISLAMRSRAVSTASSASQPKAWLRLAALPNLSAKYGIISSSTRGATGEVAWLSTEMGSLIQFGSSSTSQAAAFGYVLIIAILIRSQSSERDDLDQLASR